jgi:hypothetical protein
MLTRILGSAVVGGALLLSAPHAAFAADTRQAPTPRIEQHHGGFDHGGYGHGGFDHGGYGHGGYGRGGFGDGGYGRGGFGDGGFGMPGGGFGMPGGSFGGGFGW